MPAAEFELEPLGPRHDRERFDSGVDSLDRYFRTQAAQDVRRRANAVSVMVRPERPTEVVGYFTLCAIGLAPGEVPEATRRRLPRYPQVSATLLGRLAVAQSEQGRGVGGALLSRALEMAWRNAAVVGSCMVVGAALDERAAALYEAHRFVRLASSMRLILPMRSRGGLVSGGVEV